MKKRIIMIGLLAYVTIFVLSGCGKSSMNGTYYGISQDNGYGEMIIKLKINGEQNNLSSNNDKDLRPHAEARFTDNSGEVKYGMIPTFTFMKNKEGKLHYGGVNGAYTFEKEDGTITVETGSTKIVYYEESSERGKELKETYNELR
ncbi:hypothetical protein ACFJX1_07780 [Enterococcus faecalis]|nr:hypothetical protein [Enterococcus faecalis]HBI2045586.1 hypothetical protein [Enterococcus faecalis]